MTPPPPARIRTRVPVPLLLPDGDAVPALAVTFQGLVDGLEHLALGLGYHGPRAPGQPPASRPGLARLPLVRPHSECLTGDVFGSARCDCGPQLQEAVRRIADAGGWLLYLRQEGRGIGLYAKLEAYGLQDSGLDTFDANTALGFAEDGRDYTAAAQMLHALGSPRVALLSNNPDKAAQLTALGIDVARQVATSAHVSDSNGRYLAAKVRRHGHTLDLPVQPAPRAALPGGAAGDLVP